MLANPSAQDDLCFEFIVQRVDGCSDEYFNDLESQVDIQTQPALPREFIDSADLSYVSSEQKFEVCFDG